MKIEYLREFIVLGTCLNFSRAADETFVSQSILSRHIASIEDELNIELLRRNTRHVELTDAGKYALEEFRIIVDKYSHVAAHLNSLSSGFFGQLNVGIAYYAFDRYMSTTMGDFKHTYPDITVNLFPFQPFEILNGILNGKYDIGLVSSFPGEEIKELNYFQLAKEAFYVALSSAHPLAAHDTLSIDDLVDETFLLFTHDEEYTRNIKMFLQLNNVPPDNTIYIEHVDMINATIKSKNAVVLMPEHINEQPHHNISYIPLTDKSLGMLISYAYRKDNKNPALNLFLEHL